MQESMPYTYQAPGWGLRYLMCPPTYFAVLYSINPWMDPADRVDGDLAGSQWNRLAGMIQAAGARIEQITPVSGLPDMVFTANAGLVDGDRFIPARMKHAERRDEPAYFSRWFTANGYRVVTGPGARTQEGAGDALPFNGYLIAGYGQRSHRRAWTALGDGARIAVRPARLVDPRYYHIDIAFCPLDDRTALFAPHAFSAAGCRMLTLLVPDLVPLTPEETALFCANSVVVGRTVIMPACTARLGRLLEQRGFEVAVADISEFLKAGGGCRCLTLALDPVLSRGAVPGRRPVETAAGHEGR
jgi:N-dimethylarginine dimethylaminohydrolase